MALPAFAAERRRLLSIDISCTWVDTVGWAAGRASGL